MNEIEFEYLYSHKNDEKMITLYKSLKVGKLHHNQGLVKENNGLGLILILISM